MTIESISDVKIGSVDNGRELVLAQVAQQVEDRYSRRTKLVSLDNRRKDGKEILRRVAEDSEAAERPIWLRKVAEFALTLEVCEIQQGVIQESDRTDPSKHFESKLELLSDPLRVHTEKEVDVFDKLRQSTMRFWKGFGFEKESDGKSQKMTDAYAFLNEADEWMKWGIKPESIASWIKAIGGMALADPTLFKQYFSSEAVFAGVTPLAGVGRINIGETIKGKLHKPEGFALSQDMERLEMHATSGLEQFLEFCNEVQFLIDDDFGLLGGDEQLAWGKILSAAREQSKFLTLMKMTNYREVSLIRPTPYENVLVPIAAALSEKLSEKDDFTGEEINEIADRLVSALRRRRVGVDDYYDICKSLRGREGVRYTEIRMGSISRDISLLDDGLAVCSALIGNHVNKEKIINTISEKVVPALVLEIRKRGVDLQEWTRYSYYELGLSRELWKVHTRIVEEVERQLPLGPKDIKPGSIVAEWSTQAMPLHVPHEEGLKSLKRMKIRELKVAGIVPRDFQGDLAVIVRVNVGNPSKLNLDDDNRHVAVGEALSGSGLYMYPKDDISAPTPTRIETHRKWLEENVGIFGIARYVGSDSLKGVDGDAYVGIDTPLNGLPHIINIQGSQLSDFMGLSDYWRRLFKTFGKSGLIIELSQATDVHSNNIRDGLRKDPSGRRQIGPEVLLTLINPKIKDFVCRKWAGVNWNEYSKGV